MTFTRSFALIFLGHLSGASLLGGIYLWMTTPYLSLTQSGRLTDLGCYALFGGIMLLLGALYMIAPWLEPRLDRFYASLGL